MNDVTAFYVAMVDKTMAWTMSLIQVRESNSLCQCPQGREGCDHEKRSANSPAGEKAVAQGHGLNCPAHAHFIIGKNAVLASVPAVDEPIVTFELVFTKLAAAFELCVWLGDEPGCTRTRQSLQQLGLRHLIALVVFDDLLVIFDVLLVLPCRFAVLKRSPLHELLLLLLCRVVAHFENALDNTKSPPEWDLHHRSLPRRSLAALASDLPFCETSVLWTCPGAGQGRLLHSTHSQWMQARFFHLPRYSYSALSSSGSPFIFSLFSFPSLSFAPSPVSSSAVPFASLQLFLNLYAMIFSVLFFGPFSESSESSTLSVSADCSS